MPAWRIGTRLYVAFGVVIALLAVLGMIGAKFARQVASDVEDSVRVSMERTEHIAALRENARDLHLAYTTFAASAVSNDLSTLTPLEQEVEGSLKDLGEGLGKETTAGLAGELSNVEKRGRAWVRRAVDARLEGSNQMGGDGSPTELAMAFNKATNAFEQHLDEVVRRERGRTAATLADLSGEIRTGTRIYIGGMIACLVIAGMFAFSIRRSVVAPIVQLTRVAHRIASEGDLTEDIRVERQDELGNLAGALAELVRRLREIPIELQNSVHTLRVSVDELERSFVDQELTFTKQAAAIQQSQVTLQEIRQTSTVAAQKAEAVVKVTEHAADVSRSGELALERSLEGLNMIRTGFDTIAENISLLSQKTSQISGITSTVKDIADQSSMLALNAAIEAVRSGEHGRGFSVVAREIRSLADQSIDSTRQVGTVLGDIGRAIREAVQITDAGERKIEAGVTQVNESSQRMRELASMVRDSSAMVRQIVAAVGQQNEGVLQLLAAVGDVAQMMDSARGRLATSTAARARMKDASERVANVIAGFRV